MEKINKYFAEHVSFNSLVHVCIGLGIAWLVSLAWHCSIVALVLGIVFLVAGIIGHIYPLFVKK